MKKIFILLTVCTLLFTGCSGKKEQPITESQSVETTSQVEEIESTEVVETEDMETTEVESTETYVPTETEESKEEPGPATELDKPQQSKTQDKQETEKEQEAPATTKPSAQTPADKETPTEVPAEQKVVTYDPYQVVSLATAKTKAYGKISIPEDLDKMLANGEITKEVTNYK